MPIATCTARTRNRKLTKDHDMRAVSVTRAAKQSCPPCPVAEICYADLGHAGIQSKRVTQAAAAMKAEPWEIACAEAAAIKRLWPRDGRPLRLHEVGDCPDEECAAVVSGAVEDAQAEGAGLAWTYTHAWADIPREAWGDVSVLASCETLGDVEEAMDFHRYAAALVVASFTEQHRKSGMIQCPEQTGASPDCATCRLCMRDDLLLRKGRFIGFEVHGQRAKRGVALLGELNE